MIDVDKKERFKLPSLPSFREQYSDKPTDIRLPSYREQFRRDEFDDILSQTRAERKGITPPSFFSRVGQSALQIPKDVARLGEGIGQTRVGTIGSVVGIGRMTAGAIRRQVTGKDDWLQTAVDLTSPSKDNLFSGLVKIVASPGAIVGNLASPVIGSGISMAGADEIVGGYAQGINNALNKAFEAAGVNLDDVARESLFEAVSTVAIGGVGSAIFKGGKGLLKGGIKQGVTDAATSFGKSFGNIFGDVEKSFTNTAKIFNKGLGGKVTLDDINSKLETNGEARVPLSNQRADIKYTELTGKWNEVLQNMSKQNEAKLQSELSKANTVAEKIDIMDRVLGQIDTGRSVPDNITIASIKDKMGKGEYLKIRYITAFNDIVKKNKATLKHIGEVDKNISKVDFIDKLDKTVKILNRADFLKGVTTRNVNSKLNQFINKVKKGYVAGFKDFKAKVKDMDTIRKDVASEIKDFISEEELGIKSDIINKSVNHHFSNIYKNVDSKKIQEKVNIATEKVIGDITKEVNKAVELEIKKAEDAISKAKKGSKFSKFGYSKADEIDLAKAMQNRDTALIEKITEKMKKSKAKIDVDSEVFRKFQVLLEKARDANKGLVNAGAVLSDIKKFIDDLKEGNIEKRISKQLKLNKQLIMIKKKGIKEVGKSAIDKFRGGMLFGDALFEFLTNGDKSNPLYKVFRDDMNKAYYKSYTKVKSSVESIGKYIKENKIKTIDEQKAYAYMVTDPNGRRLEASTISKMFPEAGKDLEGWRAGIEVDDRIMGLVKEYNKASDEIWNDLVKMGKENGVSMPPKKMNNWMPVKWSDKIDDTVGMKFAVSEGGVNFKQFYEDTMNKSHLKQQSKTKGDLVIDDSLTGRFIEGIAGESYLAELFGVVEDMNKIVAGLKGSIDDTTYQILRDYVSGVATNGKDTYNPDLAKLMEIQGIFVGATLRGRPSTVFKQLTSSIDSMGMNGIRAWTQTAPIALSFAFNLDNLKQFLTDVPSVAERVFDASAKTFQEGGNKNIMKTITKIALNPLSQMDMRVAMHTWMTSAQAKANKMGVKIDFNDIKSIPQEIKSFADAEMRKLSGSSRAVDRPRVYRNNIVKLMFPFQTTALSRLGALMYDVPNAMAKKEFGHRASMLLGNFTAGAMETGINVMRGLGMSDPEKALYQLLVAPERFIFGQDENRSREKELASLFNLKKGESIADFNGVQLTGKLIDNYIYSVVPFVSSVQSRQYGQNVFSMKPLDYLSGMVDKAISGMEKISEGDLEEGLIFWRRIGEHGPFGSYLAQYERIEKAKRKKAKKEK